MKYTLEIFKQFQIPYNWDTIRVGIDLNLLIPIEASNYAIEYLMSNPDIDNKYIIELASGPLGDEIKNLLLKIYTSMGFEFLDENSDRWRLEVRRWRYALLKVLRDEILDDTKLLEKVDELYFFFDRPKDMQSLIYYLPPEDGYDPTKYSYEENINKIIRDFNEFLINESQFLSENQN